MTSRFAHLTGVMIGAGVASGAETTAITFEHPFEGRGEFVDWAERTTAVLAILILIVVVITLIFGRQRLSPPRVNFLRFVGLCALPIFLIVVGTFANFEGSKRVEFCQSCHTAMGKYVDDMQNPASETLAATHFKNRYIQSEQCYHCHADYGVHGAIGAKNRGLVHLYYWVIGSSTAKGETPIQLYGHYANDLCLRCHAGGRKFLDVEDHIDFQEDLMYKDPKTEEPGMSCVDCHGPAHLEAAAKQPAPKGTK